MKYRLQRPKGVSDCTAGCYGAKVRGGGGGPVIIHLKKEPQTSATHVRSVSQWNNASGARNHRTDTAEPFCAVAFCTLHALCSRAFKRTMPFLLERKSIRS